MNALYYMEPRFQFSRLLCREEEDQMAQQWLLAPSRTCPTSGLNRGQSQSGSQLVTHAFNQSDFLSHILGDVALPMSGCEQIFEEVLAA